MGQQDVLLSLKNVDKSYGKKQVLKNLSMTISKGKVIGLLGPNGSGKTTIIKLINGLLATNSGEISILGKSPSTATKSVVAYLPDVSYLSDDMRVKDVLELFKDFYKDFDETKAFDLLEVLDISPKDRLKNLSKGNKEKVQLILVMSRKAKLYVLDEPIGGVDPAARDYILKTIINNYSEDASVIISTHLIADIEPILDEVIFIKDGEVILQGNTDDLREEHGKSVDNLFRERFKL